MIYLDNAATTEPYFRRADYVDEFKNAWMNANSNHNAKNLLDACRADILDMLGFKTGKILFCRSSTEAVQWIAHMAKKMGYMCVTSPYEHDSVWDIRSITLSIFDKSEYKFPCFGFVQMVNQMTGLIQDIKSIALDYGDKLEYLCCDLTATIGKYQIPTNLDKFIDAAWFDAHKIHGEGNIGCIWLSDRLFDKFNGSADSRNEYNLIHGTPDVEGAVMLAHAISDAISNCHFRNDHSIWLISVLRNELQKLNIKYQIVGDFVLNNDNFIGKIYGINAIILDGIDADALTQWLSTKQIYIGKGASACAGAKDYRVLEACGISKKDAEQTIRISFSSNNSEHDMKTLAFQIAEFKKLFC